MREHIHVNMGTINEESSWVFLLKLSGRTPHSPLSERSPACSPLPCHPRLRKSRLRVGIPDTQ